MASEDEYDETETETDSDQPHVPSDVDAMGKEKRRQVIGKTYGPTLRKQFTVWGGAVAVVLLIVFLGIFVVGKIDNAEIALDENAAPWAKEGNVQLAPRPVDYPRNGPENDDAQAPANPPPLGADEVPEVRSF